MKTMRYLIYLIIATAIITQASFALYMTSDAQSESGRVAKFNVEVTHDDNWSGGEYIDEVYDEEEGYKVYTFTVTNNSEMPVVARLVIDDYTGLEPVVDMSENDWIDGTLLEIGERKDATLYVSGSVGGSNDVEIYFEYDQID